MNKLFGGLQIAAGLLLLGTSGLCIFLGVPELLKRPEDILNPLVITTLLCFAASLWAIYQGWRKVTMSDEEEAEIERVKGPVWIKGLRQIAVVLAIFGGFQVISSMFVLLGANSGLSPLNGVIYAVMSGGMPLLLGVGGLIWLARKKRTNAAGRDPLEGGDA